MMDWEHLRYLLAIQREGNLTRAAATLGVTRTTVGRRLQRLEEDLGVRLFDRTPEGLVATGPALDLVSTAAQMEALVFAAENKLLSQDPTLRGPLRVSTTDFVHECFSQAIAGFAAQHPEVELTLVTDDAFASLTRREADVVIRLANKPDPNLFGKRIARLHFALFAAPSLVERFGPGTPLEDWPWVGWDKQGEGIWLDQWLEHHAPGARFALRISSFPACLRSVLDGVGVGFLPRRLGQARGLHPLGPELGKEARDLWALTLPELAANPRVRAFLDHAYEAF
jgi:DNA-binding transcriptional LysR family regulator